jgi:hypothetical protein
MSSKEVVQIVRNLQKKGYKVRKTKRGHLCVNTPKGPVFCSSTPSDQRAMKNFVAMLKRKGVDA